MEAWYIRIRGCDWQYFHTRSRHENELECCFTKQQNVMSARKKRWAQFVDRRSHGSSWCALACAWVIDNTLFSVFTQDTVKSKISKDVLRAQRTCSKVDHWLRACTKRTEHNNRSPIDSHSEILDTLGVRLSYWDHSLLVFTFEAAQQLWVLFSEVLFTLSESATYMTNSKNKSQFVKKLLRHRPSPPAGAEPRPQPSEHNFLYAPCFLPKHAILTVYRLSYKIML